MFILTNSLWCLFFVVFLLLLYLVLFLLLSVTYAYVCVCVFGWGRVWWAGRGQVDFSWENILPWALWYHYSQVPTDACWLAKCLHIVFPCCDWHSHCFLPPHCHCPIEFLIPSFYNSTDNICISYQLDLYVLFCWCSSRFPSPPFLKHFV